jgi:type II secretory pathway pseudopilin PulG
MKEILKRSKKFFSIVELMTVVLVILLIISLMIPTFVNLKKNARSAICKSQLRQIGVMTTNYASDNGGYLPNDNITDIKLTASSNNKLYYGWNGHLLPYADAGVASYNRRARLGTSNAKVYTDIGGENWYVKNSSEEAKKSLANVNDGGWCVVNEAFQAGGYNDLKVFICPEIHANTYDVGVSMNFNGLKIPRISQMSNSYFQSPGVPTTYFANELFFGWDGEYRKNAKSLRIDEISDSSNKALVVEGGFAYAKGTNGIPELAYYNSGDFTSTWRGITKTDTGFHRMNFVHDNYEQFWIMNSVSYVYYFPNGNVNGRELATKFNNTFAGKAIMFYALQNVWGWNCYSIISYIDPSMNGTNGDTFKDFFKANPPGVALANFKLFYEPEFHYLTGEMNVLFGDGSVIKKDQAWLSMNKDQIANLSKE